MDIYKLKSEDIDILENFLTKEDPQMTFEEMKSFVRLSIVNNANITKILEVLNNEQV